MSWEDLVDDKEALVALPLADRKDGVNTIIGSASLIIPGVFLTARHLIDDFTVRHESIDTGHRDWELRDLNLNFEIDVLMPLKEVSVIAWHVTKVHLMPDNDLAILIATSYNGEDGQKVIDANPKVKLDLHLPKIGTNLMSLGYPNTQRSVGDNPSQAQFRLQLTRAPGTVEHVDKVRTRNSMPPRIQTNAPIKGGMSGGPVFNEHGYLFAINHKAIDPTEHHNFYTSFVTPLVAAVVCPISLPVDSSGKLTETSLMKLAKAGRIEIKGLDHFRFKGDDFVWDSETVTCSECTDAENKTI